MKRYIPYIGINFGADPELFLKQGTKIIGSERVLPKEGIVVSDGLFLDDADGVVKTKKTPVVIRDGVQVEFNVLPNSCRQSFSNSLRDCFLLLDKAIRDKNTDTFMLNSMVSKITNREDIKPCFDQTVEVSPEEMANLSPKSQQLGCSPSLNAYGAEALAVTNASNLLTRSAGGHLHLGTFSIRNAEELVKVLDVLLGNTCVLIDRNPGNIERRKMYGKAGEYRLPKHGLEYRVLSNFWLRSYQLMSFVTGMARFGVSVAYNQEATDKLLSLVDLNKVRYAIDNNDYDMAMENFLDVQEFIKESTVYTHREEGNDFYYPLEGQERMDAFMFFVDKGLDYWFPQDINTHWLNHLASHRNGWENFLDFDVTDKMSKIASRELVAA